MAATVTEATRASRSSSRKTKGPGYVAKLVSNGVVQAFLIIVALAWLVPTFGLLIASLRSGEANATSGWWKAITAPAQLTISSYQQLLDNPSIIQSFWNTVLISVPTTILVVVVAAMAGYAFALMQFRGKDWMFLVVVGLLVVPLQIALIPVARLYGAIGLFGQIPGVVLFHVAFGLPFAIFLLRNFFIGIPDELIEAARLVGAGEMRIFAKVVLPLGLPAIASLAIFQFLWTWNDLLVALVFAGQAKPLTLAIQEQTRQFGSNITVIAPGAFITMLVPLIVFFAFQRYFTEGILAGSGK